MAESPLMTLPEVAKLLRVNKDTAYRLAAQGRSRDKAGQVRAGAESRSAGLHRRAGARGGQGVNLDDLPLALTRAQVCEALQIGSTKCWEMINTGEIAPVIRSGRMVRIPRHVIEEMLGLIVDQGEGAPTLDADAPDDHAPPSQSDVRTLGRGSG